jgi:hypothetical protein
MSSNKRTTNVKKKDNMRENSAIGNGYEDCLPDSFHLSTISVNFKVNFG